MIVADKIGGDERFLSATIKSVLEENYGFRAGSEI
jgi:hypothetical protein